MFLRHKPSPFQDVFILSWALYGVYMWHIKIQKDKCKVCQDSATLLPSNQNNTTHEMRLFSIFVTLVMRKMHGFVMKTREKDSRGFSSCSSLSVGFLWNPRHIPERFCAKIQNAHGNIILSYFQESFWRLNFSGQQSTYKLASILSPKSRFLVFLSCKQSPCLKEDCGRILWV